MDSFFVSVERLRDPSLIGKPVAVGGTPEGRGVISSASYEARAFGVRSAMPAGQALRLCPQLILVKGHLSRYSDYTQKVRAILEEFTPLVEMASLDEAYLDLGGTERLWGPPLVAVQRIREAITSRTGLPCSAGLGTSKMIAKIASGMAKPSGLLWVPDASEANFLAPLPIRRLPGIGPRAAERLHALGITRLGDLANQDPARLEKHLGRWSWELVAHAQGRHDSPVSPGIPPKQISAEETFSKDIGNLDTLAGTLAEIAEKIAYRLRTRKAVARTVTVKYRYADFETHTASLSLTSPTDDELEILQTARTLFKEKWNGKPLRLIGIACANLLFDFIQLDLLEPDGDKKGRLHRAIDQSRGKHGFSILRRGSSLPEKEP